MKVLPLEELQKLLPMLREYFPKSVQVEAMLRNHLTQRCAWPGIEFAVDEFPDFNVVVCRPDRNSKNVVGRSRFPAVTLFCKDPAILDRISREPNFLDWSNPIGFSAVEKREVVPILYARCQEHGKSEEIDDDDYGTVVILNPDTMPIKHGPSGFVAGTLDLSHAEQINAEWKYQSSASLRHFQFILASGFPTAALFEETNLQTPVAYIMYTGDGSLGTGFVHKNYRGCGFFQLVCYHAAKKIQAMGQDIVWAYIAKDNVDSFRAFRKMNAQIIDPAEWCVDWFSYYPA